MTCDGHDDGKEKIPTIRQGEIVWAKHRNSRYYKAKVDSIHDTLFYMVTFSDDSFSEDLYPSDVTVASPSTFFLVACKVYLKYKLVYYFLLTEL